MRRRLLQPFLIPMLAAVVIAGCEMSDRSASQQLPTSPTGSPALAELLDGGNASYSLVHDGLTLDVAESVSATIGREGGQLSLLGHTLAVPHGAVSEPTQFTLTVLPTGYVEVDLTATVSTLLGGVLDVGSRGFRKPVALSLTYSRATGVPDPSRLLIVHAKGPAGYEELVPVPSRVDERTEVVKAELEHFSRYVLAQP